MTAPVRPIVILLVEDDPGDELMTLEAFADNTHDSTVHVVRDGEQALDFLFRRGEYSQAPRPDLVLLDLNLPKYSGRQVLARIRAEEDLADLPVIILTTSSSEDDIMSSYRLFANAYVTKPVDLDQFTDAINQIDTFFTRTVRLPSRT
ncbi:response regulator [Nocardia noduli]|uniref:response regulator n=1 Tax=Nocardia noduli TaxID=2815722 RepID=UPI001C241E69|nr:response regulator [Nocardia noduli]